MSQSVSLVNQKVINEVFCLGDTVAKRQEFSGLSNFVPPLVLRDLSRVRCCVTSRACLCISPACVTLATRGENLTCNEMEKEET